jgi:hypothetical protein
MQRKEANMPQPKVNPPIVMKGTLDALSRKQISQMLMKILKNNTWDNGKRLGLRDKRMLERLYKFTNDPNAKAGAISKIVSSIGAVGASLAANIGEIITGTVLPKEQTKREQARLDAETRKASIEANRSIQEQAIAAGVWNSGLAGNPDNNPNQQQGSTGQKSGDKSPGSFLGG